MSGRGLVAGVLALGLWPAPAHAWAPKRSPAPVVEVVVDDAGASEEPLGSPSNEEPSESEASEEPLANEDPEASDDPLADEDPATREPEPAPPSPSTDPRATAPAEPSATHDVPADDFESELGGAPGGYHGHGVILERAPPDGQRRILVGSILAPLGAIATVSSAVGLWLTMPQHCTRRLGSTGIEPTAAHCEGLFAFSVVRVSYGALMLGTGATILALGIIQRERYRKWKHGHGMRARVEPVIGLPSRGNASLGLRLRF
jgi:hypothetical protein